MISANPEKLRFYVCASAELTPDFVSRAIMKWMRADFSHVLLEVVDDETGHAMIWDCAEKGVTRHVSSEFLKTHKYIHKIEITSLIKYDLKLALGWLWGSEGNEYGSSQYLGFIIPGLAGRVSNGREKLICSEYVAYFIKDLCEISLYPNLDVIDPKMVIENLVAKIRELNLGKSH